MVRIYREGVTSGLAEARKWLISDAVEAFEKQRHRARKEPGPLERALASSKARPGKLFRGPAPPRPPADIRELLWRDDDRRDALAHALARADAEASDGDGPGDPPPRRLTRSRSVAAPERLQEQADLWRRHRAALRNYADAPRHFRTVHGRPQYWNAEAPDETRGRESEPEIRRYRVERDANDPDAIGDVEDVADDDWLAEKASIEATAVRANRMSWIQSESESSSSSDDDESESDEEKKEDPEERARPVRSDPFTRVLNPSSVLFLNISS